MRLPQPVREVRAYWSRAGADALSRTGAFLLQHLAVEIALLILVALIGVVAGGGSPVSAILYPLIAAALVLLSVLGWNLVSAPVRLEQAAPSSDTDRASTQLAIDDILQELRTNRMRLEEAEDAKHYPWDFHLVESQWNAHSSTFSIADVAELRKLGDDFYTAADHLNRLVQRREQNGSEVLESDDLAGVIALLDRFEVALREKGDPTYEPPPQFHFVAELEHGDWAIKLTPAQVWRHGAFAWVWVTNDGPTAKFAAQVLDITGVPQAWGDYIVAEPAWDQKDSPIIEIPRGHRRKLKLASILRKPRGFWFWTSEARAEMPGHQWALAKDQTADIGFVLEVTNTTTDQSVRRRGSIKIPRETDAAEFALED